MIAVQTSFWKETHISRIFHSGIIQRHTEPYMYLVFMSFFCLTETSGPAFDEFLELIGKRVPLKGFEGYRAQLDNRSKF